MTTYVKFVNLFPEIKHLIQDVFKADNNLRSADAELQQRASEYLQLSIVASTDVLVSDILINFCKCCKRFHSDVVETDLLSYIGYCIGRDASVSRT